jgi:hypothetical protein
MPWTYGGDPANSQLDAVRFLVGDTNSDEQLSTDGEINFALGQSANIYFAAAIVARGIAAAFARGVFTKFDAVSQNLGKNSEHYLTLAMSLEEQGRKYGAPSLGIAAGGIKESEMLRAAQDTDRRHPAFGTDQHNNPPKVYR